MRRKFHIRSARNSRKRFSSLKPQNQTGTRFNISINPDLGRTSVSHTKLPTNPAVDSIPVIPGTTNKTNLHTNQSEKKGRKQATYRKRRRVSAKHFSGASRQQRIRIKQRKKKKEVRRKIKLPKPKKNAPSKNQLRRKLKIRKSPSAQHL